VKVLSGDNRHVVGHVARSLGLDTDTLLTGAQVAVLKDEALWNLAERTTVFAEVDPQQKERIVRALQRMGHCVGYLGDGINDAPSLFTADVGVSVEGAVDVARQSADVVRTRRDLGVLRDGVVGGLCMRRGRGWPTLETEAHAGSRFVTAPASPSTLVRVSQAAITADSGARRS